MLGPLCGLIIAFAITQYIKRRMVINSLSILQKRQEEEVHKDIQLGVPSEDAVDSVIGKLEDR